MSKIKVLHCIHALSGGGAERQLKILVDNLQSLDVDCAIFCADDAGNNIQNKSVKIFKVPVEQRYRWGLISMLNSAIKEFNPDVVHTWLPASMTIPAILVARWNRKPIVFSYRNRRYFHTKLTYPEYILALLFSSKIVSNNPVAQSIFPFRWLYKKKSGELISNAVLIDRKHIKIEHECENELCNILFAGRITYQKNIESLLRALSEITTDNWKLTVCGVGEYEDEAIALVKKLGIENKVIFNGYCENLYGVMKSSDLLVFPSRFEGMPNVLVEALEIGLPCLVSNILPHKYILGKEFSQIMFEPEDVGELREKLKLILSDKRQLIKMAEKGRKIASAFTPYNMAKAYVNVYESQCKNFK